MIRSFIIILVYLITCVAYGQSNIVEIAKSELNARGEVYFSFKLDVEDLQNQEVIKMLQKISVDNIDGNEVYAYANSKGFDIFLERNLNFNLLTPPSLVETYDVINPSSSRNTEAWNYYPSWPEYLSLMNEFATNYPNLCELVNIGSSIEGRDILCIHINNNLGVDENEPEFLYTATIHGDEVVGYVLTLRFIDYLLSNYTTDPQIANIVNNIDIWINPLANPDGTFADGNSSVTGATRFNANSIDLNRNFADPDDGPHPDDNEYQPETQVFMDFAEDRNFVMSSNMHGGSEVVNYPWDTWSHLNADDDWWVLVSREYADLVHDNSPSGYFTDLNNGITNGYAWYTITGGRQDYMNYFHNIREMTLELSTSKMPPANQLDDFWNFNYRSLIAYLEQSLYGFSGIVTNAQNGSPVQAKVFIENHDEDNTWVYSHQPVGNYHRPIKAGIYDVKFSAFGYYDQTINITVSDFEILELNVELIPIGPLTTDFSSSTTIAGEGSGVDFYDETWGTDLISWIWTFEGGDPAISYEENPQGINYNVVGEYDVTLTVSDINGDSDTKTIDNYIVIIESILIDNINVSSCNAVFYDTGAENANYNDNEDFIITFFPDLGDNQYVMLDFVEFDVQNHFDCQSDYLVIYDGSDINAPKLGKWCGTNSPGSITASNSEGALTILFHSNASETAPGWKAILGCDSNVGITTITKPHIVVSPNPAKTELKLLFEGKVDNLRLMDIQGRVVYSPTNASEVHTINVMEYEDGIYLLSFEINGNYYTEKIIVNTW
jgi:zinc carboxypeptidase/CUB-like protein/type IX secretion system substrate protein